MSAGRYTDSDPRVDPFSDNVNDRNHGGYNGQDYSHPTTAGNDIPLQPSNPGGFFDNRGYTGLPHNDHEADLSTQTPPTSFYAAPGGAASSVNQPYYASSGFGMSESRYSDSNYGGKGMGYGSGSLRPSTSALDSGPSPWLQQQQKGAKRSKWLIWGSVVAVVGLVIVGVVVGVVVSRSKSSSSSSSSSGTVNQTDPNDPSTFVKDSRLHQAFYGMAYTPKDSQLPGCGNKLADVITDIQLMSQLTKRIRLYGSDCNQTALVLEAIKQTKVDMEVFLGNYPVATDAGVAYARQRDAMKEAIKTYGTDHIAGVTVGNEFMLNYLNANGATEANSATGDVGAALLITNITDTRQMLADLNLDKTIPVGTSDAGSYFNTKVLEAVDYGMANVHPWFANVSAEGSAAWTANFFQEVDVAAATALSNNPKMYIAETGWPTESSDAGNANNGASSASVAGLQTFIDTFVCQANTNGTGYFFFEFFDEPWKDVQFGGVEGWWGLFTSDRELKNITIPTCTAP